LRASPAPLIAIVLLMGIVASSASFAVRGLSGEALVSGPVVWLRPAYPPGANESTSTYGTIGEAVINATTGLFLTHRSAIYYNDFSSDPFATGSLRAVTCQWTWNSSLGAVSIEANQTTYSLGGECVAVANASIYNYTAAGHAVYIGYLVWRSPFAGGAVFGFFDTVYLNESIINYMYTAGLGFETLSGRTGDNVYETLFYYDDVNYWTLLNYTSIGTSNLTEYNYLSYVASKLDTSTRELEVHSHGYTTETSIRGRYRFYPSLAGMGWYTNTTSVTGEVYYDNLVITVDHPVWLVNVTGLLPGWTVYLYNSTGGLVASATADSSGVAVLSVAPPLVDLYSSPGYRSGFIIVNATLTVKDEYNRTVISQEFPVVVGGDLYTLEAYNYTIFYVESNSTTPFTARLSAQDYNCSETYLRLYLVNTTGVETSPLVIPVEGPPILESGSITMTPSANETAGEIRLMLVSKGYCYITVKLEYTFSSWRTTGWDTIRLATGG